MSPEARQTRAATGGPCTAAESAFQVALGFELEDQARRLLGEAARAWPAVGRGWALARAETGPHFRQVGRWPVPPPEEAAPWGVEGRRVTRFAAEVGRGVTEGWPKTLPSPPGLEPGEARWVWWLPLESDEGTLVGLVALAGPEAPPEAIRRWADDLLHRLGPVFSNGLRVRRIRNLVYKDDTAECFNRRYFDEFLLGELARAARFHTPLSLIFFDMDNLKEVNTRLGHAMGSQVLREVSRRVQAKIRRFDRLFRFGGDEFCIVLPETEWHGAMEVAQRVREAVASRPFLVEETGGEGVPMTASLGIASFPLHARTLEALIEEADRAMQRVKATSKNGIGVAEVAHRSVGS